MNLKVVTNMLAYSNELQYISLEIICSREKPFGTYIQERAEEEVVIDT